MADWTSHSPYSDPGRHSAALDVIGRAPGEVALAVQGLLIHGAALEHYGLAARDFSRETLTVEQRLSQLLARNDGRLDLARRPEARAVGTCRDYALLVCAIFRHHGLAARVRCGFASYLGGNPWEDHWVCEVRDGDAWTRIDAQLDAVQRRALGTSLGAVDLPEAAFIDAGQAWLACRSGADDPTTFGHGEARGLWFVLVNLMRDRLALRDHLTSAWDGWRTVSQLEPTPAAALLASGDRSAGDPAAPVPAPWWAD